MTKQILLLFLLILFSLFLVPQSIFAHVLETDGSIGAVLHVDPGDDPIAGQQSSLFFALKDTKNQFSFASCHCLVLVKQDGKTIHEEQVADQTFLYTFPSKGIYTITLRGEPMTPKTFQPFSLSYDLRVSRETNTNQNTQNAGIPLPFLISGAFIIFVLALIGIFTRKGGENK